MRCWTAGGLLQELKVNALLDVELIERPEACKGLSQEEISTLFHVAQESLTNVRKHAHAASVTALLERQNGAFRMVIADDGRGFDLNRPGGGQGLRNMRERVESLGGQLGVHSGNGKGTQLTIELPITNEGESRP